MAKGNGWFLADPARRRHPVQLVCLPHAGGGASQYRTWLSGLADDVDVLPVQLPGRENRILDPFPADLPALVDQLTEAVLQADLGRIALFGHSMGAVLATKVCAALEATGTGVRHLFVSGHAGPGMDVPAGSPLRVSHRDSDDALLTSVAAVDPSAGAALANRELRAMFLAALRADLRLIADAPVDDDRVAAPLTVLGGADDPLLTGRDLTLWSRITSGTCTVHRFPGDHFYLATGTEAVLPVLRAELGLLPGEMRAR